MKKCLLFLTLSLSLLLLGGCGKGNDDKLKESAKEENVAETEEEEVAEEEEEAVNTNITDFVASVKNADLKDVKGDFIVDIDGSESGHKLDFSNQEDIHEISFFKVTGEMSENNYPLESREYVATYYSYLPMDQAHIRYDANNKEFKLLICFVTKGGQTFEYCMGEGETLTKLDALGKEDLIKVEE